MYTDDVLVISENAEEILRNDIRRYFELKKSSIGHIKIYLEGQVHIVELDNCFSTRDFSSSQYVKSVVKNVE